MMGLFTPQKLADMKYQVVAVVSSGHWFVIHLPVYHWLAAEPPLPHPDPGECTLLRHFTTATSLKSFSKQVVTGLAPWCSPLVLATQEAEAGQSLEPRSSKL